MRAVQRAIDSGVTRMLSIGTGEGPPDLEAAIRIAEQYAAGVCQRWICIRSTRRKVTQSDYDRLASFARSSRRFCCSARSAWIITGSRTIPKLQAEVFVQQMQIAAAARKPISIHTRDAWDRHDRAIAFALGAYRAAMHHALLHGRSGTGEAGARSGILSELFGRSDLSRRRRMFTIPPHMRRWIVFWWKQMRRTWRQFRFAASGTSRRTSHTRRIVWPS